MSRDVVNSDKILMSEWDWARNNALGFDPNLITLGSDTKVWWICTKCGYEWMASIGHRDRGRGCPKCAFKLRMQTRVSHYGSLLDKNPKLCEEWDYKRNKNIKPNEVLPGSGLRVWWKCKNCGFEWQASISNRNSKSNKTKCPNCSLVYQSSIAEKIVLFYLSKLFPDIQENVRMDYLNNRELDMFLPKYNIAIEYDGGAWHDKVSIDEEKDYLCALNNIQLIRIREKSCPTFNNLSYIIWTEKPKNTYAKLNEPIRECLEYISKKTNIQNNIIVDIEKDYDKIIGIINQKAINNSIVNTNLINEWDYSLNTIDPHFVSTCSNKILWWRCNKCGFSWRSTVNNRTNGQGCPYCSHKVIKTGYNDLATTHPDLLSEWDYSKNTINPKEIFAGSNKKVWWICKAYGHSWEAVINSRSYGKSNCPYCTNKKVLIGFNDLATTHPELLCEWNYDKNTIKPTEITAGCNKKVWWICKKCHSEWETAPNHRTSNNKTNCPRCAEKYIGQINSIKRRKDYKK
ncbi:MAG: zinc-ribbon domain-containing protein [Clostridia bacterium]|nr:zinc-ribbon domain-containing protein [Clostridia bacterium]